MSQDSAFYLATKEVTCNILLSILSYAIKHISLTSVP